jgi:S1 RNA binding domain
VTGKPEEASLAPGRIVYGVVIGHHPWGVELELEEADAFGTIDLRFLSDDPADMNEEKYPQIGVRLRAKVQGMMPNGQLRLTIRRSDLER